MSGTCRVRQLSLCTRIGSNGGNPQSTIMYHIQNIHTHSGETFTPSRVRTRSIIWVLFSGVCPFLPFTLVPACCAAVGVWGGATATRFLQTPQGCFMWHPKISPEKP